MPDDFRRLHPLTPILRGWKVFAAVVAIAIQQAYSDLELGWLLTAVAASIPVAIGYGWLSWRSTHYRIGPEDLLLETGVLFRRSRRVRLDRLQAVEVVRPLVARALGLAELRLEVAGGSSSEAPLAYLSDEGTQRLRAELLARAAGIEHGEDHAPEAPERILLKVPLARLVEAQLRSGFVITGLVLGVGLLVLFAVTGEVAVLGLAVPFLLGAGPVLFNGIAGQFDFTVAESPDGLRLRRGLLETRSQTVPPGRVQAVRLVEPPLWRPRGWCRVEANVAGYVGEGQQHASVLLPVAPREEAMRVLSLVLPGVEISTVALAGVPRSARWLDPVQWRFLAAGADDQVFVARRGRLRRETDVVPHEKVQSVRLSQGWLQRALGLATLHVDTTPGPVKVSAAHRDVHGARRMLDEEVTLARRSRATARPERWMRPLTTPPGPTVTP
ncbi:MAG: PH domain-containing protein [Actinomycetes bacterium]